MNDGADAFAMARSSPKSVSLEMMILDWSTASFQNLGIFRLAHSELPNVDRIVSRSLEQHGD